MDIAGGPVPSIAEQVAQVPTDPGCYLWKDASGQVIYVGKAKNLRARMRQYVTLQDDRQKIPLMMQLVASFDYIVVDNEHEALVLERNLIGQYHPYFNVDYKDDKSYPYIAITKGDVFPAIKYTREKHRPDTRYFGPYTDSRAARATIDTLRKVCPICSASCTEWKRVRRLLEKSPQDADLIGLICAQKGRPCFDYHVGRGPGVCAGMIDADSYAKNVRRVERFLSGQRRDLIADLKEEMSAAAAELDFERAGRVKRRLEVIDGLDDRQQVVFPTSVDIDVIGFYREETIAGACVFVVREGRTQRTCEFILDKGFDVSEEELIEGFVKRYYDETADIPAEVDVACELEDGEMIGEWLTSKRGRVCRLHRPQRGEKHHLLETAQRNARHALLRYMMRTGYADDRTNQALLQLESALALPAPPLRIECFDISTIHGRFTVASMVVFTNGRADKSQYRRFKIRAERGERLRFHARGPGSPLCSRAHGGRALWLAAGSTCGRWRQAAADRGTHAAGRAGARHPRVRSGKGGRGGLCALGRDSRCASHRLGIALPHQAGARRGPPFCDHVPPRASRQGYDRIYFGRGGGYRTASQKGHHEALWLHEATA